MNTYVALKALYALSSTEDISVEVKEINGIEQLIECLRSIEEVSILAAKVLNNLSNVFILLSLGFIVYF